MQTLPPVVRDYLTEGKYTTVAKGLMTMYGLRIDQGGVLEREIMLLLMGVDTPDEFMQALAEEAKLDQKTVDSIVQDVNTQIFIPLREEEMSAGGGGMNAQQPVESAEPAKPMMPPPPPPPRSVNILSRPPATELPKGTFAPPPQSPRYINQNQEDISSFIHTVPTQQPKPINRIINKIPPPAQTTPAATPAKPIDNTRLLEDHEEPHIEFNKPAAETPLRQALRAAVPQNLPGAMPGPTASPTSPQATQGTAPKPYTVDPYHEPIE